MNRPNFILVASLVAALAATYFLPGIPSLGGTTPVRPNPKVDKGPTWAPTVSREGGDIVISAHAFVAMSPDGTMLAMGYDDPMHPWFGLYYILDDRLTLLPLPNRRVWIHPRWSSDSKRLVVASNAYDPSKGVHERLETQLDMIDIATGTTKTLVAGPGLRAAPFFSRDGRTVYYFRGKACVESCRSIGGHYDLFRVRQPDTKEEQLTSDGYYQAEAGDESADGNRVLFSAQGYGDRAKPKLYSINLHARPLEPLDVPLEEMGGPRIDGRGRIFVKALAGRDASGRYIYDKSQYWQYAVFIVADGEVAYPKRLLDLSWKRDRRLSRLHLSEFDIDANGNILHCIPSDHETRCSGTSIRH